MNRRPLGVSGLEVSALCLGSTTWGSTTDKREAFAILDAALDAGVNFLDCGEIYPVPFTAGTFGRAEEIIGAWLSERRVRHRVLTGTKAVGPGGDYPWIRGGRPRLDRADILAAVEGSLRRLGGEAVDFYQIHWPARRLGAVASPPDPAGDGPPIEETLGVLAELVAAGKIRAVGVCNETPWGVMTYLRAAEKIGGPRLAAVQNPYNLLNRSFENGLAEVVLREGCGLLAYSPLAHGTLTGKYLGGALPADSRFAKFPFFKRYRTARAEAAVRAYCAAAQDCGRTPLNAALAYILSRPFAVSVVVAASNVAQLEEIVAAAAQPLPAELEKRVEEIHAAAPNPCA